MGRGMIEPVNRFLLALGLVVLSGCKSKAPVDAPAAAPTEAEAQANPEGWALTLPKVDGYLLYQRTLLVQAGKLSPPRWDGGLKKFEEPSVEVKADLDERARREAGLTPDDVLKIEAMLSQVSARRMTYKMMHMDQKMPELPEVEEDAPVKGYDLKNAVKTQQTLKKSMEDMPEERESFGSHNIDVLLQREEELLKNWALMMEVPELAKGKR